ncbi:MAG: NADH-quinone oxidoreductase subunit J [Holophagales bacterium]|jgi:NADH-quinone oxidoreductase subunit J|nr:NADH-quinone oxidoreductase subunit J [Holophagales bacterium]
MFLAFALITLGGAFALLIQRNAVQAGLCMMLSFFGMAGLFLLLANPVAAALQIIVYSGAITILFLFVVMLLQSHREEPSAHPRYIQKILSAALVIILALGAIKLVQSSKTLADIQAASPASDLITLEKLGERLFTDHLVALEAIGLLLLSAMIAAVVLIKKEA